MNKNLALIYLLLFCNFSFAQNIYSGFITSSENNKPIKGVEIYNKVGGELSQTDKNGFFKFNSSEKDLTIILFARNFNVFEQKIFSNEKNNIQLRPLSRELMEVEVKSRKQKIFELKRLNDVEGTSIFAGKKNEVVLVKQSMANLASNNARQIYSQVTGLNIYQNDDAGLQLNIGGRGLDPNRTSNFNTRQNGYDISADVLGYPESYYTPAAEGLEEIQIVRGAASLQYGTQFGGLVNFIMKKPVKNKKLEFLTRNTIGSNNLYTNFTSASGTIKNLSYYSFINYKNGDGFRPNSNFESLNFFNFLKYNINNKLWVSTEFTYLNYLAQQAGGLSDQMFLEDYLQSNRSRNWFQVNWLLYNMYLNYAPTQTKTISLNLFGLNAQRNALGFRTNRVSQVDSGNERDLIKGDFNNYGIEIKLLSKYKIIDQRSNLLLGGKFYKSDNISQQGPGSNFSDADFNFYTTEFPNYNNQSNYEYPNLNIAFFGENLFYINDKLSITPGFRIEHIKTESIGYYKKINLDGAGNVILNQQLFNNNIRERSFVLIGAGLSYKGPIEIYGNFSQNFRSVTFADISIINPAYSIDPNISDEKGHTIDFGLRGELNEYLSFDMSLFNLYYNDRIGFIQKAYDDGSVKSEKGNVGNAHIYGVESLIDFNLNKILLMSRNNIFNFYINSSFINSQYVESQRNGVEGNKVEFVPNINLKSGIKFGYNNFLSNMQFSYLSSQFTDASNAIESNLSGVIGEIPEYYVLDFSSSYSYKNYKFEFGVNNILNYKYFTRRATGYPGPGIIPSPGFNLYSTLQIKI
jgi:Fe(3+) dicitrate transport protein